MSDTQVLIQLAQVDTESLRLDKELRELPQAQQIMECRAKRKEIKGKQDKAVELADAAEAELAKLQLEEERVVQKIADLQADLDSAHDYRVTASLTRDMEGQVKRQAALAEEQNAVLEKQIKIDRLARQVADMLAQVDHREQHLTEEFKELGGGLKSRIDELAREHGELIGRLDAGLARRYEDIRAEKAGIGVGRLEGDHCSVCRTTLLEGQMRKLQAGPDLTECPNCHRLLVVREDGE